jgi:hypothetical protein
MMFSRLLLPTLCLLIGAGSLRAAVLTKDIRETTNPAAARPKVEALIKAEVAKLTSKNPSIERDAREALVAEVVPGGTPTVTPSAQFLDVYAEVLNAELDPLTKNPEVGVRLSAGIVASRVAERANNARLLPTVINLLKDERAPAVYWGVKASKHLLVPVLSAPNSANNPLMPAFQAAVKKHIKFGPMVQAAYDAFKGGERAPAPVILAMVKSVHEIMELRQEQFMAGIPELPASEAAAMDFLTKTNVWKHQSPQSQFKSVQLISNLAALAGQRVGGAQTAERNELAVLLRQAGGVIQVIGTGNQAVNDAAKKLYLSAGVGMGTDQMADNAKVLYPALKQYPAWKDLKPPPAIQAAP